MDIDIIEGCRLKHLDLGSLEGAYQGPAFGVDGIRKMLNVHNRPFIGGVVKPKIGLTVDQLVDVCKQMADGGIDFIKEDEILNFQEWCPIDERVEKVQKALDSYDVLYAPCITEDSFRFPLVGIDGTTPRAVHINWWCGFGYYRQMRRHIPYRPAIFFQKSGDKVITTGPYSVDFKVVCYLANLMGCDIAHVGMYGGYMNEAASELKMRMTALKNTIPSFSCGAEPCHVIELSGIFGNDIMITSGGYIHSHPKGITYAVKEFRDAC